MKNTIKRILAIMMTYIMAFSFMPCFESYNVYADSYGISNPRVSADETVWDCVYFGSYPQTEVVADKSQCGTTGNVWSKDSDCIIDSSLYKQLQNSVSWGSDNVGWVGNSKYKRIRETDTAYGGYGYIPGYYDWSDSTTYHYFKYEPIKWRVLNVNGNDALLLADKVLDCQQYNNSRQSITWETCSLRSWLNGTFYNTFSSSEKSGILTYNIENLNNVIEGTVGGNPTNDRIFLLSQSETFTTNKAVSYGFATENPPENFGLFDGGYEVEQLCSKASTYAKALRTSCECDDAEKYRGNVGWALRSPGFQTDEYSYVDGVGDVVNISATVDCVAGIRPALHLNPSNSAWTPAGTVSSNESNELNFSKDVWGFYNYSGFNAVLQDDFNVLLRSVSTSEYELMKSLRSGMSSGHCYGMSVTTILNKMNSINLPNHPSTNNLRSKLFSDDAKSLIGVYHITQDTKKVKSAIQQFDSKSTKNKLQELATKADSVKNGGNPIALLFTMKNSGHAVVAYALEPGTFISSTSGKSYNKRILLYDCNNIDWNEDYCLLFNEGTSEWEIPAYYNRGAHSGAGDIDAYINQLDLLKIDSNYYDYSSGYKGELIIKAPGSYKLSSGTSIYGIDSETGDISGSGKLTNHFDYNDGEDFSNFNIVLPDDTKEYEFKSTSAQGEELECSILYDNSLISVNSNEAESVKFNSNGEASVNGNEGDFDISVTKDNVNNSEFPTYVVSGDSTGDVSLVVNKNGAVIEGNNLQGLVVTATDKNDNEHQYVITDDVEEIKLHADNNQIVVGEGQNGGSGTGGGGSAGGGEAESTEEIEEDEQKEEPEKELTPVSTSFKSMKSGKNHITLKWKKRAVSGYEIQYSTVSNFKKNKTKIKKINKGTTTSATIRKLKSNKKYYIRIRSYKFIDNDKVYSKWSVKKAVRTKKIK